MQEKGMLPLPLPQPRKGRKKLAHGGKPWVPSQAGIPDREAVVRIISSGRRKGAVRQRLLRKGDQASLGDPQPTSISAGSLEFGTLVAAQVALCADEEHRGLIRARVVVELLDARFTLQASMRILFFDGSSLPICRNEVEMVYPISGGPATGCKDLASPWHVDHAS